MVRRLVLFACVVALGLGFTVAAFAQEASNASRPHDEDKVKLTVACTCKWDVKVNFKREGGTEFHDTCFFERFSKKLELPDHLEEVVVKTELLFPFTRFLSADCKLDKKFKHGRFKAYEAACKTDGCFIHASLREHRHDDDDDDDDHDH
jgi:hypothetical protein